METFIMHSTPLKDLRDMIGTVIEEKLKQFTPAGPPPEPGNGEYLTRAEVCTLLKISLSTLHYYTKDGTVQGYKIGGRILYKTAEVNNSVHAILSNKYKHGRG